MYSVVMLVALTSASETPEFGGRFRQSHHGCCCAPVVSCHGCYGSCHGFTGFYRRGYFGCWSSCHGCYSSCHGCYSSCHGCYGSCHGHFHSCHGGCGGCYGTGQGVFFTNFYPTFMPGTFYRSQPLGSAAIDMDTGTPGITPGTGFTPEGGVRPPSVAPSLPILPSSPAPSGAPTTPPPIPGAPGRVSQDREGDRYVSTDSALDGRAQITVLTPKDARLFVDAQPREETGSIRRFHTPVLKAAKKYTYTFRATLEVDGLREQRERVVTFRANDRLTVDFSELNRTLLAQK